MSNLSPQKGNATKFATGYRLKSRAEKRLPKNARCSERTRFGALTWQGEVRMNERNETVKSGSLPLLDVVVVAFVIIGFVCLLSFYGYALLPFWPDEICFLQPAQNLAEGKGMGTPALDDLLPGISQRTYWQPPVYFLVLAVWGKLVGFDVMSSRLLSRVCGVGVLLLLWLLALRWGVCSQLALICIIWTALDLTFQYNSNLGRMDTMNAFWLMACLLAFTEHQRGGKIWQAAAAGFFGALATLTHFIAIPSVLTLGLVLAWRKRWRDLLWFSFPVLLGWGMWLIYAAQDWQSFWAQLCYQFARKGESGFG
jgi:4-amino-4-deoxy-L-arabinose transferase-like glycosyltransferase